MDLIYSRRKRDNSKVTGYNNKCVGPPMSTGPKGTLAHEETFLNTRGTFLDRVEAYFGHKIDNEIVYNKRA